MSEEQKPIQEQQGQKESEAKPSKIELDQETYAALLDKIDELEVRVTSKGKREEREPESDVDALAEEGRRASGEQEVDIDSLSPKQLLRMIDQHITKNVSGPLAVQLNELKYSMEIDRLSRPKDVGGEGFKDLMDYRDEIMSLMIENPKMSMKRAYTLAKAENPGREKATKATEEGNRDARLRHLPPHPKKGFGERPGQAEASTTAGEPKDLKDAASRAFDEVFKGRE